MVLERSGVCWFYTSVDIVKIIWGLGCGTLMAKVDVKTAYCMVPVHPDDCYLLGMQWEGKPYIDTALPFGLRSAPKIFNAFADAIVIMHQHCHVAASKLHIHTHSRTI